jgi:hypothetical protein
VKLLTKERKQQRRANSAGYNGCCCRHVERFLKNSVVTIAQLYTDTGDANTNSLGNERIKFVNS